MSLKAACSPHLELSLVPRLPHPSHPAPFAISVWIIQSTCNRSLTICSFLPSPSPCSKGPTRILRESQAKNKQLPPDSGPRGIGSTEVLWVVVGAGPEDGRMTAQGPRTLQPVMQIIPNPQPGYLRSRPSSLQLRDLLQLRIFGSQAMSLCLLER